MTRLVVFAFIVATASGCSGTSERDGAVLDDPALPDAGSSQRYPDAGPDVDDLDAGNAEDALVPIDADRSDHGGQCIEDETCIAQMSLGPCELAACQNGWCVKASLADGASCDDGDACTVGDVCKNGLCNYSYYSPNAPGCLQDPEQGSLRFTEIMGNPGGNADPVEGQWFEVYADDAYRLKGLKLVYYEWEGETMPMTPSSPVIETIASEYGEAGHMIFLRSQDIKKNRWGSSPWSYSKIQFSKTKSARLMVVGSSWDGSFPVTGNLIFADIELAGGTFADEHKGRSWQRSSDPENETAFCYSPTDGPEYWDGNFGSPFQANAVCP